MLPVVSRGMVIFREQVFQHADRFIALPGFLQLAAWGNQVLIAVGHASLWANRGEPSRKLDYQVWCGPAMGAFNSWVKDTFLAEPKNRGVVVVGQNLMYGAAVMGRLQSLRSQGVRLSALQQQVAPRTSRELEPHLP